MLKCILLVRTFCLLREEIEPGENKTWKQKMRFFLQNMQNMKKLCNPIQHKTTQGAKVKLESVSDKAH
jgi:hypothetical protein